MLSNIAMGMAILCLTAATVVGPFLDRYDEAAFWAALAIINYISATVSA